MPFYEFQCQACGKEFEYFARNTSDAPKECVACGAVNLRKLFSPFNPGGGGHTQDSGDAGGCSPENCCSGSCPFG